MQFVLNRHLVETRLPGGIAVVDFLRDEAKLKGTKVGCREGDCGACTVLLGTLAGDWVNYKAVNACLLPLGKVQGRHLVTIEGLNQAALSPVQKALVEEGATQCGFCTPGIVVSATAALLDARWGSKKLDQALFGNICRCTGYASIKRAVGRLDIPQGDAATRLNALIDTGVIPRYFEEITEMLQTVTQDPPALDHRGWYIGGGTDLMVQRPDDIAAGPVHFLPEPHASSIREKDGVLTISGGTTFDAFSNAPAVTRICPEIASWMTHVASFQVRNVATVAGNLANASPIGDLSILLLALDATLVIGGDTGKRRRRLQSFFRGYKDIDLKNGETIDQICIDAAPPDSVNFERVAKRAHMDIASVNTACAIWHRDGHIEKMRLSAGGVAPIPRFLEQTSALAAGRPIGWQTALEIGAAARREVTPISDVRGSAEYKARLLERLVLAHFHTLFGLEGALP